MQTKSHFWMFWKTLPGILTGIAALLTAIAGAYVTFGLKSIPPRKVASGAMVPAPREQQQESYPASPAPPYDDAIATITESDGSTIAVKAGSVTWVPSITPHEFTVNSGQSISFDKIKAIDILDVEDMTTRVQVTLADGETIQSSVDGGHVDRGTHFEAESKIGKVSVRISLVRRIAFQR